jgi:D-threo-aldose 1-dehydrogenase
MARHSELVTVKGTDLEITKLSFGSAPLGSLFQKVAESDSDELVSSVLDSGIGYLDTAPLYGYGVAERRIGRIVQKSSKPYVLSTKVGRLIRPGVNTELDKFPDANPHEEIYVDTSPDGIRKSLHDSLERLGVSSIQIVYIHDADDWISDAVNVVFPVLAELRSQGLIKAVGIGMNWCETAAKIMKDTDLNIALIAGRYTLLDQSAQTELYPLALKKNVSIVAAGVYNSGVLARPERGSYYDYLPASDEIIARAKNIGEFLKAYDVSLTSAALQFPLRHPAVATVLSGAGNANELKANIADFNKELPANLWAEMESAGLIAPLTGSLN